jgi:hypothetical protein
LLLVAGHMRAGVFLRRAGSRPKFAGHRAVDEFDHDVGADVLEIPITPSLERMVLVSPLGWDSISSGGPYFM